MSLPIKLVVVGDGYVGKTWLLIAFTAGNFPDREYNPTFENHAYVMEVDGIRESLTLWDTPGQEGYEKLRSLCYPSTDGFILCFSVDNDRSYENIATVWHPEIKHSCPRAPLILVGTKTDLRDDPSHTKDRMVSRKQGIKMAAKIKAYKYVECSANEISGVKEVFEEAVRAVLSPKRSTSSVLRTCRLL